MKTKNSVLILLIGLVISSIGVARAMNSDGAPKLTMSFPLDDQGPVDCVGFRRIDFHDNHPLIKAIIREDLREVQRVMREVWDLFTSSQDWHALAPEVVRFESRNNLCNPQHDPEIPLIFLAVRQQNPSIAREILTSPLCESQDFNINKRHGDDQQTLLHEAVRFGHYGVVRELLHLGASPLVKNNKVQTPRELAESIKDDGYYDHNIIDLLVVAEVQGHKREPISKEIPLTQDRHTCTSRCVPVNAITQTQYAESLNAGMQAQHAKLLDAHTQTRRASGRPDAVSRVISTVTLTHNAPAPTQSLGGEKLNPDYAFRRALILNNLQGVRNAIHLGANVYEMFYTSGNEISGMFKVLILCDKEIVKLVLRILIAGEFDINRVYSDVGTLLHAAVSYSGLDVVQCILDLGASPSKIDSHGNTPLGLTLLIQQYVKQDKALPQWLQKQVPLWKKTSLPRHSELDLVIQLLEPITEKSVQDKKDKQPQWR